MMNDMWYARTGLDQCSHASWPGTFGKQWPWSIPMSSPEKLKVRYKRKLGAGETNDTTEGTKGMTNLKPRSEPQVKMEEDLGIVLPLNIDAVKVEEDLQSKVVQNSPAQAPKHKRQRVRFSKVVSYRQDGHRAPAQQVRRRTAQLAQATEKKPRRRVDTAEVNHHSHPTKQVRDLNTRRKTKGNNQQSETRTLESKLHGERTVAEAERISNILTQLLSATESIAQEIKLLRAGINNLQEA